MKSEKPDIYYFWVLIQLSYEKEEIIKIKLIEKTLKKLYSSDKKLYLEFVTSLFSGNIIYLADNDDPGIYKQIITFIISNEGYNELEFRYQNMISRYLENILDKTGITEIFRNRRSEIKKTHHAAVQ